VFLLPFLAPQKWKIETPDRPGPCLILQRDDWWGGESTYLGFHLLPNFSAAVSQHPLCALQRPALLLLALCLQLTPGVLYHHFYVVEEVFISGGERKKERKELSFVCFFQRFQASLS
jgi:hypothetical protein